MVRRIAYLLAAALAAGSLATVAWSRDSSPSPRANRLAVTARANPTKHGIAFTVRYTIATPPVCSDLSRAARKKICSWYVKQQARLILSFRSGGLISLIRPETPTGHWSSRDPGGAYAEWRTFVSDLDLMTIECTDHKHFSWKLTMIDPYRRPDVTRTGTYTSGACPPG